MNDIQKKNVETISLEELEKMGLVTADIYSILGNSQKEIVLLKAGEYILPDFIDKFRAKGVTSFFMKKLYPPEEDVMWESFWQKARSFSEISDFEIYEESKKLVEKFKDVFVLGRLETSLLSYINITHKVFSALSQDFTVQYAKKNYFLFKRSMLVASLSLPLILSFGYNDFSLLKDIYNMSLLLSFHMADEKFTLTVKNALTLENREKGLGVQYLQLKSPKELTNIIDLSKTDHLKDMVYAFKFSQIKDLLLFYQTLIITKRHHQIINEKNIPDWMSVIIFIDKVIDYQDFEFKKGDAKSFLKEIIEKKMDPKFLSSYSFQKIKNLLVDHWEIDIGKEKMSA